MKNISGLKLAVTVPDAHIPYNHFKAYGLFQRVILDPMHYEIE